MVIMLLHSSFIASQRRSTQSLVIDMVKHKRMLQSLSSTRDPTDIGSFTMVQLRGDSTVSVSRLLSSFLSH